MKPTSKVRIKREQKLGLMANKMRFAFEECYLKSTFDYIKEKPLKMTDKFLATIFYDVDNPTKQQLQNVRKARENYKPDKLKKEFAP